MRVRKVFRKGLATVSEDPDHVMSVWLRFEHAHGDRDDIDAALQVHRHSHAPAELAKQTKI